MSWRPHVPRRRCPPEGWPSPPGLCEAPPGTKPSEQTPRSLTMWSSSCMVRDGPVFSDISPRPLLCVSYSEQVWARVLCCKHYPTECPFHNGFTPFPLAEMPSHLSCPSASGTDRPIDCDRILKPPPPRGLPQSFHMYRVSQGFELSTFIRCCLVL